MSCPKRVDANRVSHEIYQWQFWGDCDTLEFCCTINDIALEIVVTKLVFQHFKPLSPNRIHISSNNPEIQKVFKEKLLWQPPLGKLDANLWVFKNNPNIFLDTEYELHFHSDVESMRETIKELEYRSYCSIL